MNVIDMEPHPLCSGMPKQAKHEVLALEESMRLQGFDKGEPVIVWLDPKIGEDRILDGRHRRDTAKKLGITEIPTARFEGSASDAAKFVTFRRCARWGGAAGQRATIFANNRSKFNLTLESAAELAGVSVSTMEKASTVVNKSKKHTNRVIKGEMSLTTAINQLKRTIPETHTDGEDPWIEIQRTIDACTAVEHDLQKIAERVDAICGRRGGEQIKANLQSRKKIVGGQLVPGLAMVEEMIVTIRKNKPKERCKTCNGAGCGECGDRRYVTAFEQAAMRNAERETS